MTPSFAMTVDKLYMHWCSVSILLYLSGTLLPMVSSQSPPARAKVSTPVNPVKQGEIFSVHCQVWHLRTGNSVEIYKQHQGRNIRVAVNSQLLTGDGTLDNGDAMFLAVRQLQDGSTVYFLSIIDVRLSDAGIYTCKVIDTSETLTEVSVDSVELRVMHLPHDDYPVCSGKTGAVTVLAGETVEFSCSAEVTYPLVDIKWSRTRFGAVPTPREEQTHEGVLQSTIRYTPWIDDNGLIFLCEIVSKAFPEYHKTCHVGPFTVKPNPNQPQKPDTTAPPLLPNMQNTPKIDSTNSFIYPSTKTRVCDETVCPPISTDIFFWILTTIVAAIVCFLFLIVSIILYIRYARITSLSNNRPVGGTSPYGGGLPPRHAHRESSAREYIYTELEGRLEGGQRQEGKYMALEIPRGLPIHTVD